jgi:hypothetical protein
MRKLSKRGQLTLFIILAIIIVAGIAGFFIYRNYTKPLVSNNAKPVYDYYLSCIEQLTEEGAGILGSRGGYIETPDFEPGSPYMPSSSQLDFLGIGVPYWFYVSGNNIVREQVPTKSEMEFELRQYIQNNLQGCDFSDFERRGYLVDVDEGMVDVKIESNQIRVSVRNDVRLSFEEEFFLFNQHRVDVNSKLGNFYDLARRIYEVQRKENFLENYALDTLTLNAPTTGFEEGCTPLFFNFNEIRSDVVEALSENIAAVKVKGNYYSNVDDYFIVDSGITVREDVNFMYFPQWPTKIEIYGDEFVEPVGLQEGLEILGFCFVEYEFIYDVVFPVLVQVSDGSEVFQFPIIVSIERNQINPDLISGGYFGEEEIICKNRNQEVEVRTVDLDGNPVPATISMSCLGERCYIGETRLTGGRAVLREDFPMCVNGFIEARAEGYANGRYLISTTEENSAEISMKKIYSVNLNLGNIQGEALVRFSSDGFSRSVMYPAMKEIEIVEGIYEVEVKVFGDSEIVFPARTEQRCFESVASGIAGFFGRTETQCQTINIPEQRIDRVLVGGGKSVEFISESSLREFSRLEIDVPLFGVPSRVEDIGENYIKLEDSFLSIVYRP